MRVEKRMTSEKAIGFLENASNEIPNLYEEEAKSKKFMEWKRKHRDRSHLHFRALTVATSWIF